MRACAFAAATYKYAGSSQRAVSPFGLGPEVATHRTERDARERKAQLSAVLPGQSEYLSSSHFKPGNGMDRTFSIARIARTWSPLRHSPGLSSSHHCDARTEGSSTAARCLLRH
jgi:hypothetical protein